MALDSSYFLKCQKITKAGNPTFDLFSQQDAAETLSFILQEICGESINASESTAINISQTLLDKLQAVYFN